MDIASLYEIFTKSSGVCTDSRNDLKNSIFFCLKGPNFDANEFALIALQRGALHVVADDSNLNGIDRITVVNDSLESLQNLAKFHRKNFNFPVIALTGSNGKTTNKELIHAVLSQKYRTYSTKGNLNNHIGVPLTLLSIPLDAEMAIIEMGANHQGEINDLVGICKPDWGMITNIGKAHLEGFGGIEGVKKGKKELYDFLITNKKTAFINADDPVLIEMSAGLNTILFGKNPDNFVSGMLMESQPFLSFSFQSHQKRIAGQVDTKLVGDYNFYNALAAACIGAFFDLTAKEITKGISEYQPANSRSQLRRTLENNVILDAYNANPSSMASAIENLVKTKDAKKIALLGHMMELGETSHEEHQSIINLLATHKLEAMLVGDKFSGCDLHGIRHFANVSELNSFLATSPLIGYTILLKGSRATTMENALEYL